MSWEDATTRGEAEQATQAFIDSNPSEEQIKAWLTAVVQCNEKVTLFTSNEKFIGLIAANRHLFMKKVSME